MYHHAKGFEKLKRLSFFSISLVTILVGMGIMMLYSAANASLSPWGYKQLIRFGMGLGFMMGVALMNVRTLYNLSYVFYAISLLLLIAVEVMGFVGMGAQRWINLGFISLQPSELMRIGLLVTLARYFHEVPQEAINQPRQLIVPVMLILIPTVLVLRQPDLGTAILLVVSSLTLFFLAHISVWYFVSLGVVFSASLPVFWTLLHEYQKKRVLIFLNPELDPVKSGYHIIQSKIALGSGGFWGKGFLMGTQSHFDFLPEKQTDFIFTMFCEEFGMAGAIILITLYMLLIIYNWKIAYHAKGIFSKLVVSGLTMTFFLYMFINMAMVMGVLPVVGIPLPFFSYGGTALLTLMVSQGIVMAIKINKKYH